MSLKTQVQVRHAAGDTLEFLGNRYVAIAPLRFQRLDGRSHLVFEADARNRIVNLFTGDSMARVYERLPGYEAARVQLGVVGLCVAVFLWTALVWPLVLVVRRARAGARGASLLCRPEAIAILLCGLNLAFLIGFATYLLQSPSPLEYGVPVQFVALLTLPLLSALLTAVLVAECVRKLSDAAISGASRFQYSLVTIAAVGFVAWLAEWNLLGYRF